MRGCFLGVAILLVVMILLYFVTFRTNQKVTSRSVPVSSPGGFAVVKAGDGHRVLLEAEDAKEVAFPVQVNGGVAEVLAGASDGKACYIGPEKWNKEWNEKREKGQVKDGEFKKGHPDAPNPGYARYEFTVPTTDDYALWLRAFWVDACGNSVLISMDGQPPRPLESPTLRRWQWTLFKTGEGDAARFHLEAGKPHVLTILNREDDLYFDQILFLGTDKSWPEPIEIEQK